MAGVRFIERSWRPARPPDLPVFRQQLRQGKDSIEGDSALLDRLAAALLAVDEANGADHFESGLARALDGFDSGAARCADVLDNDHLMPAGVGESFEKLLAAVLFRFLANQETVDLETKFKALPRDRRDDRPRVEYVRVRSFPRLP